MKVSELIRVLQKQEFDHGDREVNLILDGACESTREVYFDAAIEDGCGGAGVIIIESQ